MKKFFTFLMVAAGFITASAEVSLTPEQNKAYMIQHSSGYYMTVDGEALKIMSENPNSAQTFTFELVAGTEATYNIKTEDGTYIGSDTKWTVQFLTDTADPYAQFTFEAGHKDGYLIMHNEGRNGYMGTDNNEDGATVYTNKGGTDGKELWRFVKCDLGSLIEDAESFLASDLDTEAFPETARRILSDEIEAARNSENPTEASSRLRGIFFAMTSLYEHLSEGISLLATTEVGSVIGGCTEENKAKLESAVNEAKASWSEADATAYKAAATAIEEANDAFKNSLYTFIPAADAKYYLMNTNAGLAMAVFNGEVVLEDYTEASNQQFEIIPVEGEGNSFSLKVADGSGYIARKGSWNTVIVDTPDENAAKITFEIYDLENSIYNLKKYNEWGYMAPDSTEAGSLVYTDKGDWVANCHWQIKNITDRPTAVDEVVDTEDSFEVRIQGGMIHVTCGADDSIVNVYAVDGSKVAAVRTADGGCDIQLEKGCYVVTVNALSKVIYVK
jgi:hypothetical protein